MRNYIISSIFNRMLDNPDIFFLNADMGINLVKKFEVSYPDRYTNVGIAEQNLISISAGLANLGFRPFAYTISNFLIHRCLEQIRNDICLHNYPVTLIGTSTGFDNAPLGPTHHILDEWGILKSIPGIDIFCPSSITYAKALVDRILSVNRPAYIRIPKGEHSEPDSIEDLVKLHGNKFKILLISYGNPVQVCLEAYRQDPSLSLLILNKLHPIDDEALLPLIEGYSKIVVVEDHFSTNGLYSTLCEFAVRHNLGVRIDSVAPKSYSFEVGTSPDYFMKKIGIDSTILLKFINN